MLTAGKHVAQREISQFLVNEFKSLDSQKGTTVCCINNSFHVEEAASCVFQQIKTF